MIIAIPLTVQNDYTELRYCLRSIEMFITKPYEIVIIGDCIPYWLNHVTNIQLPDIRGKKQLSIRSKILAALEYADEILFMNDDIYFLQPATEFPYYWHGYLKHNSETGTRPLEKELIALKKPIKHFDGHYPIVYNKGFKEASEHFSEECIIKSMYCNYFEIEGVFAPDCKILKASKPAEVNGFIKDKHCFSTGAYSLQSCLPVLNELFPIPSNFEI